MLRFKGVAYPIRKSVKGLFYAGSDLAQIKADLLSIILTIPGERVFEPEFGTPLNKLNYNQPYELVIDQAKQMIASSIKRWEKRVQVSNVECIFVGMEREDSNLDINVQVFFIDPEDINNEQSLSLQVPLGRY